MKSHPRLLPDQPKVHPMGGHIVAGLLLSAVLLFGAANPPSWTTASLHNAVIPRLQSALRTAPTIPQLHPQWHLRPQKPPFQSAASVSLVHSAKWPADSPARNALRLVEHERVWSPNVAVGAMVLLFGGMAMWRSRRKAMNAPRGNRSLRGIMAWAGPCWEVGGHPYDIWGCVGSA